jgi:hypothetical protein
VRDWLVNSRTLERFPALFYTAEGLAGGDDDSPAAQVSEIARKTPQKSWKSPQMVGF